MSCGDTGLVRSGRGYSNFGRTYDYHPLHKVRHPNSVLLMPQVYGASRHYTLVFNVFVFMQIFNFVNARKIEDEFNIMENVMKSKMFLGIVTLTFVLQVIIVLIGNRPLTCSPHVRDLVLHRPYSYLPQGLSIVQWLISFGFGAFGLIVCVLIKLIPLEHNLPQVYLETIDHGLN